MFELITGYARMIVSCGPCASIPYASIACSLFALPLLVVIHMLYWLSPVIGIAFVGVCAAVALASFLIVALTYQQTEFILDKIIGVMLVFMAVPFTAKFMLIGLVLFHSIRFLVPFMLKSFAPSLRYSVWHSVLASLGAGLLTNVFLRFVMWVAV